MRLGIDAAISRGARTLWLVNDDATLDPDALHRSLAVADDWRRLHGVLPWVVGSMRSPVDGSTTYGGWSRRWFVQVRLIPAPTAPIRCATTSCNSIVVPVDQYLSVGGLDPPLPTPARRSRPRLPRHASRRAPRRRPGTPRHLCSERTVPLAGPGGTAPRPPARRPLHEVVPAGAVAPLHPARHYGPIGLASFVRPYVLIAVSASVDRIGRVARRVTAGGRPGRRGARR